MRKIPSAIIVCLLLWTAAGAQITTQWNAIGSAGGVAVESQMGLKSMLGFVAGGSSGQGTQLMWSGVRFCYPGALVNVGDEDILVPFTFALHQNYPNPFNPSTRIEYSLARSSQVTLTIYNILGQRVVDIVNGNQAAGQYSVHWDGRNEGGGETATGVYFYRITAGDFSKVQKMLLIK
jgi:hypothetical protein